jgi:hypothetical protein
MKMMEFIDSELGDIYRRAFHKSTPAGRAIVRVVDSCFSGDDEPTAEQISIVLIEVLFNLSNSQQQELLGASQPLAPINCRLGRHQI